MIIKYFSKLIIYTHLSDRQKEELVEILGAENVGSETSFNFYYSLGYGNRMELYKFVGGRFPQRIVALSNLNSEWAMISFSVLPSELDNPTLENDLENEMLQGLATNFGVHAQLVKIKPIDFETTK